MHTLELSYFDMHAGRGEVPRMALHFAGIPYTDTRVKFQDWGTVKPTMPFGAMPLLVVDGQPIAQSNTINRFVGKLAGLYPADPLQAAFCDEAMDAVEDISIKVGATMFLKDEEQKKAERLALTEGPLTFYLTRVERLLTARGGRYFADDRLTVADLKVYLWIRHLTSGALDYIPTDLASRVAPALVAHFDRVHADPKVVAYRAMRGMA